MKITQCWAAGFSPTGTTRAVGQAVLQGLGGGEWIDVTARPAGGRRFAPGEVVAVAVPVFGGRVPGAALEHLAGLQGGGAFAAAVAVYGGRAYEDALLELKDALEAADFVVIGAAAFVGRHSMAPRIAAGRPNAEDLEKARQFGALLRRKAEQGEAPAAPAVPGNRPYRQYGGVPFRPAAGRACTRCGTCARECPVGAIPQADPRKTDPARCISCMRCAAVCPQGARRIPLLQRALIAAKLAPACKETREPELFL